MVDQRNQDFVISQLCDVWKEMDGEQAFVMCRPDTHPATSGACDAVVWRKGRVWAVEHTLVHTSPERPHYLRRLQEFMKPIADELHARYPRDFFMVRIPMTIVRERKDRQAVAVAILEVASEVVAELRRGPVGTGRTVTDAPGALFPIFVYFGARAETREGQVWVGPYGPDDELAKADLRRALKKKHAKLARYRTRGASTVLLLDVPETFAIHDYFWGMFVGLSDEVPLDAYDEVVLAGSVGMPPFFHYLKRDGRLMRSGADYGDLLDAQRRLRP